MPDNSAARLRRFKGQAECEMAAFLKATTDLVGRNGLLQAGNAWILAMESLDWPNENHEKFFRRVTILAISRLLANSDAEVNERSADSTIEPISATKSSLSSENRDISE